MAGTAGRGNFAAMQARNQEQEWTAARLVAENAERNRRLNREYDPLRGIGCCGRRVECTVTGEGVMMVPEAMTCDKEFAPVMDRVSHARCRIRYDFEYWCAACVRIKDKVTARIVPFVLNAPQRRVAAMFEDMRTSRRPIRLIMLKARQWGGSTLVQIYMAWIQIVLRRNWNSLICGHLKDAASAIKGMYSRLLASYPAELWPHDCEPRFTAYEGSRNVSRIAGRYCLVAMGSAESQEAIRGYDIAMAHLTEVAFWRTSPQHSPESLVRSVCGSVALQPDTVIVMESTANGTGNYFHGEWLRARAGRSDKVPVFVPWHEIEIYRCPVGDAWQLWCELDDYERRLWTHEGLTLEMINWYHCKRKEYSSHAMMKAEYPGNDIEAFACMSCSIFDPSYLDRLRRDCRPALWVGEIAGDAVSGPVSLRNLRPEPMQAGALAVWTPPDLVAAAAAKHYVAVVDVGGLSDKADFSVITVFDARNFGGRPEVVAQWRGHTYHDLLAWKAAQLGTWYRRALLVVESNTLETEYTDDGGGYILEILSHSYPNLYRRRSAGNHYGRLGFHTNVSTKSMVVNELMRQVRDGLYVERSQEAVDELSWFERKPQGGYGAMSGRHDDMVMTRAIGLYVIATECTGVAVRSRATAVDLKIPTVTES